ncbi:hypothetical protein Cni_G07443 [Canna indica]|uniref:Iron-phytosiderophore transporter n=1 Tax=Canna indica TaxID=4628 RepID=A0AAQ3JYQ7_9LILI|nr:hypothetical protein Cni_G07443 [Canna indica]
MHRASQFHHAHVEKLQDKDELEKGVDLEEPMETEARYFKGIPPWSKQITLRGLAASLPIGTMYSYWVPLPMAMAVPFLVGASFAIDMCVGSLIVFAWHKINSKKVDLMVPAVASGLICGDGLWILLSSLLALAKVNPPVSMKFVPGASR